MKKSLAFLKTGLLLICISCLCLGCSGLSVGNKETVLEEGSVWQEEKSISGEGTQASSSTQSITSESSSPENGKSSEDNSSLQNISEIIYVDVCGEVENPGVYRLSGNSRVYQAIEMAGGMTKKASKTSINQAELLTDGEQIYVPSKSEVKEGSQTASGGNSGTASSGGTGSSAGNGSSGSGNTQLININTASEEELMNLSGIGEARAQAIVKYRETNGNFTCIEDLMNVSGIGSGIYSKIADQITV